MTEADSFADFLKQVRDLGEILRDHYPIAVFDGPRDTDLGFIWNIEGVMEDISGAQAELSETAQRAWQAISNGRDLETAQRALVDCEEPILKMLVSLHSNLMSYEQLADLYAIGQKNHRQWDPWARLVGASCGLIQEQIIAISRARNKCLQEIAERTGVTAISMKVTNIV